MSPLVLATVAVGFASSLILQAPTRFLLLKLQIVDVPNHRSSHTVLSVRGAGWAVLAGFIAGGGVLIPSALPVTLLVLVVSAVTAVLGGLEDTVGLPVKVRLVIQAVISAAFMIFLVVLQGNGWWWVFPGIIVMLVFTNMANFMDGINGISVFNTVAIALVYAATGMLYSTEWFVAVSLLLGGVFLAFLPWNLHKTFLGDVGSYLLGGTVAVLAISGFLGGMRPEPLVGGVLIYAADTITTMVRRVRAGEDWSAPHRTHVYQRLTDLGYGHLAVAAIVAMFTALCGLVGLGSAIAASWLITPLALLAWMAVVYLYLSLPRLLARDSRTSPSSHTRI